MECDKNISRGYYLVCLTLYDANKKQNASVLHSENINLRFIMAYSDNLMTTTMNESPVTIEMYNPTNDGVLVELFECSG
jgi:hypothetical protein